MATDDNEQVNSKEGAPAEPAEAPAKDEQKSAGSRMNAAKAFYRQLYAGNEVSPEEYGMELGPPPKAEPDNFTTATGPCPNCTRMETQAREHEQKANEAEGFYKRIAADFENYKRRVEREKDEYQTLGSQRTLEALLPALDDLDRAQATLTANSDPKALLDAFKMVSQRFQKCLEGVGIKAMDVVGEVFDPRLHEPVQEVKTTAVPDGHVAQELRRGYSLKDKVLRPALVNVATHEGAEASEQAAAPAKATLETDIEPQTETAELPPVPPPAKKSKTGKTGTHTALKPEAENKETPPSVIEIDEKSLGEEKTEEELLKSLEKTASDS